MSKKDIFGDDVQETKDFTSFEQLFAQSEKNLDRKLRVGLTVPVGRVDLGLWAQRDRSTINAYRGTDAGLSVSFRMNLL